MQDLESLEITSNGTFIECKKDSSVSDQHRFSQPNHVINECFRKIRISVNIENAGKTPENLEYIFIRDILDLSTDLKLQLLNPLVIRIRQEQVVLAFPFRYLSAVNGKASELIINYENRKNFTGCDDTSPINPTCGIKHEKGIAVPFSEGFCCFCPEKPVKEKQIRGGQDCSIDVGDPDDFDKQKYKASAHCLHFSEIWYTVNALSQPHIQHEIFLQVYNQRYLSNGSSLWIALTDIEYELGIKNPYQYDENKTNGANDYLLIPKDIINPEGSECDTAGVSYEAFAKQANRCNVKKETCLKNQPLDFWEADEEKIKSNNKGSYKLENYGIPYKDPIIIDSTTQEHWLALEYYDKHQTILTVELNADDIVILPVGKEAQISKVITSSIKKEIEYFVNVQNIGLVPAQLSVRIFSCGFEIPDSKNASALIPPQMQHIFAISTIQGNFELDEKFECTIQVISANYGIVSQRKVTIKPFKRCICNYHCACMCMGESLKCNPLTEEEFHAAGFRGSLPLLTAKPSYRPWIIKHPILACFALFLFLILLGFAKANLYLFGYTYIGNFGLENIIYRSIKLAKYYEIDLKDFEVAYDEDGYPINPKTNKKAQTIKNEKIFALNVIFFIIWPWIKLYYCFLRNIKKFSTATKIEYPPIQNSKYDIEEEMTGNTFNDHESSSIRPDYSNQVAFANTINQRIRSSLSDSFIFVDSDERGKVDSFKEANLNPPHIISKELAKWQKGVRRIEALR